MTTNAIDTIREPITMQDIIDWTGTEKHYDQEESISVSMLKDFFCNRVGNTSPQPAKVPCIDRDEAAQLMELMQAALKGEKLALLGRLSENQLYNKLAALAGNKEAE